MKILVSRKAALIATIASLPFVSVASYFCIRAYMETRWPVDALLFWGIGTAIFMLGSPFTLIYMLLMPYIGKFLIWSIGKELGFLVVPVYILLFICQWITWSQLIVIVRRRIVRRGDL